MPLVGVGASAGGLPALTRLFGAVPSDVGMAFFVVMHLNPSLPTALVEVLSAATSLPVRFVRDGVVPEAGVVYVAPPGQQLRIESGFMRMSPTSSMHRPIDGFLASLAAHAGQRAIGVLLSGAGSDGMLGLTAIRDAGGITLVQDDTATFPGMAQAALEAGVVDLVASPEGIAEMLAGLRSKPYVRGELRLIDGGEAGVEGALTPILTLLQQRRGIDFRGYKVATLRRRVLRRAVVRDTRSLEDYLRVLRDEPAELDALFSDVLIKVTEFFRDPEVFESLASRVLPRLYERREVDGPLRIWVVGCSTGEEAYSIAMTVLEHEPELGEAAVQIFATDVSDEALSFARQGRYSRARCAGVSEERLERFFIDVGEQRQVRQDVRDMCVFARHNVATDPPFSRMDLVSCRNVLIYFGRTLQERVIPTLHYALQPWGGLLLGRSETVGESTDLFEADGWGIGFHSRKAGSQHRLPRLPTQVVSGATIPRSTVRRGLLEERADEFLLRRYAPPGAVVDANLRVERFIGDTSRFLTNVPGAATQNILKMAHPSLRFGISEGLEQVRLRPERAARQQPRPLNDDAGPAISVVVAALDATETVGYLVLFETVPRSDAQAGAGPWARGMVRSMAQRFMSREDDGGHAADREELAFARSHLHRLVEEHEANAEEQRTTAEEIRSSNEELQCTNEELQTAREEVLATNEELTTVNEELEGRNRALAGSRDDLRNLLESTAWAIIVVGADETLRWFSHGAGAAFGLSEGDIGRTFDDLELGLTLPSLGEFIEPAVLEARTPTFLTRHEGGGWYSIAVRSYRRENGRVDGAVITIVDVDELKRAEAALSRQRAIAEWIVDTVRQPLAIVDEAFHIVSANPAFCRMLATTEEALRGRPVRGLDVGLDTGAGERWLQSVVSGTETGEALEVVQVGTPSRHLELRLHRITPAAEQCLFVLLVEDVTSRRLWEQGEAEMVGRVLAAQADEREALARELHDETGQALSALIVGLRGAAEHIA